MKISFLCLARLSNNLASSHSLISTTIDNTEMLVNLLASLDTIITSCSDAVTVASHYTMDAIIDPRDRKTRQIDDICSFFLS